MTGMGTPLPLVASTTADPFEDLDDDGFSDWVTCWQCGGEGFSYHDCGEDTCCCLYPEDNVTCDVCNGEGGWPRPPEKRGA